MNDCETDKRTGCRLHATGKGELEVIDPETSQLYFIVDGETHRRAMEARQHVHRTTLAISEIRGIYLKGYDSGADCHKGLTNYFKFYCHERPHQSLDYRTPWEVHNSRS